MANRVAPYGSGSTSLTVSESALAIRQCCSVKLFASVTIITVFIAMITKEATNKNN